MPNQYERKNKNTTNYEHPKESNLWELHKAMGYDPLGQPILRIDDTSVQHTSKDRVKNSAYEIVFFNTFQFDKEDDVWDELTTTGGSAVFDTNTREVNMSVDASIPGAKVVRQTRAVQRYIPGRAAEASFAIVFGLTDEPGVTKRYGVFDENNGVFLEVRDSIVNFVIRSDSSGVVEEKRVSQPNWNQDVLDGTGDSGIVLDLNKRQIVVFEYEWYGAGITELKFVINGHGISAHKEFHANVDQIPWMGTPFLPIRGEIENVSATSGTYHMFQGSSSFLLEGSTSVIGIAASVASPITGTTMGQANTWYPILSVRLSSDRLNGVVLPSSFQVATTDNTNLFYRLVSNATIGTGASAWLPVPGTGSTFAEYQTYTSPSAIADENQGSRLDTGFVIQGGSAAGVKLDRDAIYQIGRTQLGTVSEVYTLLAAAGGSNKSAIAALNWLEVR